MKLSILVPSVSSRRKTFLPTSLDMIYGQLEQLSIEDQEQVEVLYLVDNKSMMLGAKRNHLVSIAQGEYTVFVDDDDRIADDYIKSLLEATVSGADVITFNAEVSLNGGKPVICDYSKEHGKDYNDGIYYRIPNHICCVKKEVGLMSTFPNVLYGEDAGYSKILLPHLKTEHKIDKILYYYDYNAETTETQQWRRNEIKHRNLKPLVDVIILSKAESVRDRRMTQQTVRTCYMGTNGLPANIIVLEQGAGKYQFAETVKMSQPFNYNGFANHGASLGSAEWIVIANNDLIFHDGWLHNLIAADYPVVSPHQPADPRQAEITENTKGYENGKHFSGWCFMIKRSLWEQIGGFDDCVTFWCSDDVVIDQLKAIGIEPMVVKESVVEHSGSRTLSRMPNRVRDQLKWENVLIYNTKYNQSKFEDNPSYIKWLERNRGI